jgi:hypothetical protein
MNSTDWVAGTGHPILGRGGRPINPKLAARFVTKTRPAKSPALAREARKLILRTVRLVGEVDETLARTARRRRARVAACSPPIAEQSLPGHAGISAQMRHWAAVQRARKGG